MMNKKLKYFIFMLLTLSVVISPSLTQAIDTSHTIQSSVNKHKMSDNNQAALAATDIHDRKAILNDDSRGLSAFFILGIIINIIMIVVFSRWFLKEWRSPKK